MTDYSELLMQLENPYDYGFLPVPQAVEAIRDLQRQLAEANAEIQDQFDWQCELAAKLPMEYDGDDSQEAIIAQFVDDAVGGWQALVRQGIETAKESGRLIREARERAVSAEAVIAKVRAWVDGEPYEVSDARAPVAVVAPQGSEAQMHFMQGYLSATIHATAILAEAPSAALAEAKAEAVQAAADQPEDSSDEAPSLREWAEAELLGQHDLDHLVGREIEIRIAEENRTEGGDDND